MGRKATHTTAESGATRSTPLTLLLLDPDRGDGDRPEEELDVAQVVAAVKAGGVPGGWRGDAHRVTVPETGTSGSGTTSPGAGKRPSARTPLEPPTRRGGFHRLMSHAPHPGFLS